MWFCSSSFLADELLLQLWDYLHTDLWGYSLSPWHAVVDGDHHTVPKQSFTAISWTQMQTCTRWLCFSKSSSGDDSSFSPVDKAAGRLDGKCHCWSCYQFCFARQSLACRASWRLTSNISPKPVEYEEGRHNI